MAKHETISPERKKLIKEFINQNNITTAQDIQEALKNMFKDTLQERLEAEMTTHLGYDKYEYTDDEKKIIETVIPLKIYTQVQEILK